MPPQKKGMGAGKVILIVFGVLGLMMFGTCAVCGAAIKSGADAVEEADKERKKTEEKKAAAADDCKNSDAVEWASVAKMLKENEAKAVSIWKGNCAKVNGVVDNVGSGIGDKPYVVIGTGEKFSLNDLRCKPKDEKKALELKKGQKITVWGVGGDEIMGSLQLDHCDW